jgi:hypothetical protein
LVNDNCSDPPLRDALGEFAGKIRLERNDRNLGYIGNWNRTLRLARGRWVHMMHSDDLVSADFAPVMWRLITEQPEEAVLVHSWVRKLVVKRTLVSWWYSRLAGNPEPEDDPGAPVRRYKMGDDALRHVLFDGVRAPTAVVRKDAARSIEGFLERCAVSSDEEYFARLAQVGDVIFTPRRLLIYRLHGNQLSAHAWLEPGFIEAYGNLHQDMLALLGDRATAEDRVAMNRRVATVAVGVAFQQAVHGRVDLARLTLADAERRDPATLKTSTYRKARMVVKSGLFRRLYRALFV